MVHCVGVMEVRVVSRRGLRSGCRSDSFTLADLAEACGFQDENVYIEMDACGQLTARGGIAHAVRLAGLAPAPPHASALLCLERADSTSATSLNPRLTLRLTADCPPLHELLLWFDENMLAHLDMPFLTLRNITDKKTYTCHNCDAEFEHPNPLKVHIFLSCRRFDRDEFWDRCISQLRSSASTSIASLISPLATPLRVTALPVGDPAQLEALAAAWGRSRDGHVCLYCGKLYSRKYGLKIHIRTHTGYKPLRCRHCLRAFGDPSNLNKHVRLHAASSSTSSASNIHTCGLCNKPLARRRDLLRHLRTHHPQHLSSLSRDENYTEIH